MGKIRPKQGSEVESVDFEDALEKLEAIVNDLEEGQIGLTEAMTRYEEGVKLLRNCYAMLQRAERKIELLTRVNADDEAECEPFDDEASLELAQQEQPRTSRRRAATKAKKKATRKASDDLGPMDDSGSLF